MTEPRRSTRARAREEAAPPTPEAPSDRTAKGTKATLKRKRPSAVHESTPGTPVGDAAPQGARPPQSQSQSQPQTLPLRITEGQPLPTLAGPQPLDLPAGEWQNIQQSGVLGASLQRSRAVWVSGVNFRTFHRKHTMPKKLADRTDADKAARARQKDVEKNFPQVGALDAQLVIEPHTFPIKLYAPREGSRAPPKKMPPPPQHYGAWPNHAQHSPHPPHSQHAQHSPHPGPYQQYNHPPYPPKHQPQPRPPPPKPAQQPPQTAPGPASTPAPDPVIHMLAARAGTDPELKAVMKIVAAGQATKAQLEFFQTHINELTEILDKNKKAKAPMPLTQAPSPAPPKQHVSAAPPKPAPAPASATQAPAPATQAPSPAPSKQAPSPAPPSQAPSPAPPNQASSSAPSKQTAAPAPPKQTPTPAAAAAPAPSPSPAPPTQHLPAPTQHLPPTPRPAPPAQHQPPKPFSPAPPHPQQQRPPLARPPPPNAYPVKNYSQPPYYQQPPPHYAPQQPPRVTYRPLTFEFVEGNGDRFYFPSYSFMEWLPNGSGAKFSFLVTKLKPKPDVDVDVKPPSTPAPPQTPVVAPAPTPSANGSTTPGVPPTPAGPAPAPTPAPTPYVAPPRIEDFDERNDLKDVDFYQPVTVLVLTDEHEVKNALPRAIRPPSVVEKYMEDVFDTCKRAEETYLAFRLPREGVDVDLGAKSGDATPTVSTPTADVVMGGMGPGAADRKKSGGGRSRKSIAV